MLLPCCCFQDLTNDLHTTAIATFASTVAFSSQPVLAAQYGGFGGSYAEVINPKDAVVNDETYQSDDVKAGISGLNTIISSVKAIRADLVSSAWIWHSFIVC